MKLELTCELNEQERAALRRERKEKRALDRSNFELR